MTAAARLLERLSGVRETGPGRWMAQCPAHEDRSPSLSVRDADGKTLVHCFAGCAAADILAACGLALSDLFDDADHQYRPGSKARPRVPVPDLLLAAGREAFVVWLIADRILSGRVVEAEDWPRLETSVARLQRIAAEVQRIAPYREPEPSR